METRETTPYLSWAILNALAIQWGVKPTSREYAPVYHSAYRRRERSVQLLEFISSV